MGKRVKKLCKSGQNFKKNQNERSELNIEMKTLQSFSQVVIDNLDKGVVDADKVKFKEVKRKMTVTAIEVAENVEKARNFLDLMKRKLHTPAKQLHICTNGSYFLSKHHYKIMITFIQLTSGPK